MNIEYKHRISNMNANVITIAVSPKEYFEKYRDKTINKKYKGLKRDTPGMNLKHTLNVSQMVRVNKTQFAGLNNK